MKRLFKIIHITVCFSAIIAQGIFLSRLSANYENGIWDHSAVTAAALMTAGIAVAAIHLTWYIQGNITAYMSEDTD